MSTHPRRSHLACCAAGSRRRACLSFWPRLTSKRSHYGARTSRMRVRRATSARAIPMARVIQSTAFTRVAGPPLRASHSSSTARAAPGRRPGCRHAPRARHPLARAKGLPKETKGKLPSVSARARRRLLASLPQPRSGRTSCSRRSGLRHSHLAPLRPPLRGPLRAARHRCETPPPRRRSAMQAAASRSLRHLPCRTRQPLLRRRRLQCALRRRRATWSAPSLTTSSLS